MDKGLTEIEVEKRQKNFGLNIISDNHKSTFIKKIIEQSSSFLVLLLIFAAVISLLAGDVLESGLILLIVAMNIIFGLYQELKAEAALAELKKISIARIRVVREGKQKEIDSIFLVPEDIIFLEEGVKVPADAKILSGYHMEVNESLLTGESIPLPKEAGDEIYMGTIVSKGHGYAKITHIGMTTKFGEIAHKLAVVEETPTQLQIKLRRITRIIGLAGIAASSLVYFLSLGQQHSASSSFLLAVSLAVAVVPESLPAVMTVIMAIGMKRMANRNAVVRKMAAIEGLGSTTLIATDKTGTLTENKMSAREVWIHNRVHMLSEIKKISDKQDTLSIILHIGIVCSTASLVPVLDHGTQDEVLGDPTEGALLLMARSCGISIEAVKEEWVVTDETPFDPQEKITSAHAKKGANDFFLVKGAPERVLQLCSHIAHEDGKTTSLNDGEKEKIFYQLNLWGKEGLRCIAFSYKKHVKGENDKTNMVFLGMVAIYDAPRKDVKDTIAQVERSGVRVVMITGDSPQTAESIGKAVGILHQGEKILTGDQIDNYSENELIALLPDVRIFARTTPVQKYRIVSLYQSIGEVVAVTGDGVNDAIALKQADVGIAMGKSGTDVAREAADIILLDDHFNTIVHAVEEGRHIIQRLKYSIIYLFTGNLAEVLTIVVGMLMSLPSIFLPIQLLYINLISDGLPSLAFAFMPRNHHEQVNMHTKASFITRFNGLYIITTGCIGATIVIFTYIFSQKLSGQVSHTGAFTVMTLMQVFLFISIWVSQVSFNDIKGFLKSRIFYATCVIPIAGQYIILNSESISILLHLDVIQSFSAFLTYLLLATGIFAPVILFRLQKRNVI